MAKQTSYGNNDITALKGADRVRLRPGVVFGSDGLEGCEHSFFEILSNSIDEAREGRGDTIIVTRYLDDSLSVQDFGSGIPVDYNQREQRYNWELVFCEMYAGGKYKNGDSGNYEYSLGLNGLGLCATQYASEYMEVDICRDNTLYHLSFRKGEIAGELQRQSAKPRSHTGSLIRWRPDLEVFTDIHIPLDYFTDVMKRQAVVNPGLMLVLRSETTPGSFEEQSFYYQRGITDYVEELLQGGTGSEASAEQLEDGLDSMVPPAALTPIQTWSAERIGRDREDKPEYKVKLNVSCCFSNRLSRVEYYHNSSFLEHGGSPERAVRSSFVSQIDSYLKNSGKYLKGEAKITYQDIEDCLVLVSSSFSTMTSYENQTKKAINNKFIYEAMTDFLKHQLEIYFLENPDDAQKIAEQVMINKRSRENAEKTRLNLKKKLAGSLDMSNRVQKFVDCRTKDLNRRELYIVEGDSALGSCKLGRDAEFQAIMPVRGKILNCLKAEYNKIFKNEIITDLIKVLGCGVEVKTKANKELASFDLSGLRWSKVIICTDADVDGFQIRTLILTMLYVLTPTLIDKGYVYIAESPLYEITTKDKTYFAYTQKEKADFLEKLGKTKYTLQRSKGLGENEPDMMWMTTMNPETRRLIKINPAEAKRTAEVFELLQGNNLSGRKEHIAQNGYRYLELADIS